MSGPDDRRDVVELITSDHRRLLILLERLLPPGLDRGGAGFGGDADGDPDGDPDGFDDVLGEVIAGIEAHADAEEQLFYPALAQARPGYGPLADALAAHQAIEDELQALDELDVGDEDFQPTLQRLHDLLQRHIADEERLLLGMVREHVSPETCRVLAQHFVELEAEDEGKDVDAVQADLAWADREAPQAWSGADEPGM
jgi:iron-sulfur cluster repair protein YtfE (RIC family)